MADLVARAVERLQAAKVRLDPGLSDAELSRIEDQFHFTFGPEHRQLLQSALPVGEPSWPDWRNGSAEDLQGRLDWPIDGVVFDVQNNAFWPTSWGERPDDHADRERQARANLARVPPLVPVFSHRYLTVDPEYRPSPSSPCIRPTSSTTATTSSTMWRTSSRSHRCTHHRVAHTSPSGQTLPKALRAETSSSRPLIVRTARCAAEADAPCRPARWESDRRQPGGVHHTRNAVARTISVPAPSPQSMPTAAPCDDGERNRRTATTPTPIAVTTSVTSQLKSALAVQTQTNAAAAGTQMAVVRNAISIFTTPG